MGARLPIGVRHGQLVKIGQIADGGGRVAISVVKCRPGQIENKIYPTRRATGASPNEGNPRRLPEGVAQIFICRIAELYSAGSGLSSARESFDALPITNRRYSIENLRYDGASVVLIPEMRPRATLHELTGRK